MTAPRPRRATEAPAALDDRARENLSFIRATMERAASFTGVPGWGGVAMGLTALVAAFVAHGQSTPRAWLTVWLVEGLVAAVSHDGRLAVAEAELLRVVCASLHCPLPPMLDTGA